MTPARKLAWRVLLLVEGGGYASELLRSRSAGLEARDAGLAAEIVFGCLRHQGQIDFLTERLAGRAAAALDAEVRAALRMGIYQLRYLDRIPPHAAVSESVDLVKRAGKRSAAGLVNAVLRRVDRAPARWPDRATELSMPAWLLARWDKHYGPETAERIARAFLRPPATYVRAPGGRKPPEERMEATGVPGCYRLLSGDPGGFRVQDIGSQSIVPLLDLQPGQRFLDLCAAPGNKTAQALESGVRAVACDLHLSRLRAMKQLDCGLVALDGACPLPFRGEFDRILVDAPCSGTGTLGRNPEIKWRLRPSDLEALHARQVALLSNALKLLAPGGRLVYSTCSLEPEENEAVVREAAGQAPRQVWRRTPGVDEGDGFFAAVIGST